MSSRTYLYALLAAFVLTACSSGSKAEKDETTMDETSTQEATAEETADEPEAGEAKTDAKTELAACTGGNVPMGATSCLLDLGTGENTYWSDTDGVDPGTAGCHYEYKTDACEEQVTDRTFGEFCLDDDRLVESNPGKDECHQHGVDQGKPDVVSCSEWCESEGNSTGRCEGGVQAEGSGGSCESARCVCDA
ncbi:MAG: hypothetical protein ACQEVA_10685 [Myxococcota bacterium]